MAKVSADVLSSPLAEVAILKSAFTMTVVIAVALGTALASLFFLKRTTPPAPPEIRVEMNTPSTDDPFSFAVSPDGIGWCFRHRMKANLNSGSGHWIRLPH